MRNFISIFFVLLLSTAAYPAVKTWTGAGTDANWNNAANWSGNTAPLANDDLVFPATSAQFSTNNNFFIFTAFNSVTFEGGNYSVSGNTLTLRGLTISGGSSTFTAPVSLAGTPVFDAAAGSLMTLAAVSVGSNGLTIEGSGGFVFGAISGSGAIRKNGVGLAYVAAALGYSGALNHNGGIFVVDANIPNSPVTVNAAVTGVPGFSGFGGTGSVGNVNVLLGAVSAGTLNSPTGILNTKNITFSGQGVFACKLGGTTPGLDGHDQLNVTGTVSLGGAMLSPIPWNSFQPAVGDSFVIIRNDGTDAVEGTFFNAPEGAIFAGALGTAFRITYRGGDGNDVVITRVPRARFDFDGDGFSDVTTFRPANNSWNIRSSQSATTTTQNWGLASDITVPADYDGDNRTDIAVFRPSDAVWYILNSATSTAAISQFGASGDVPVSNDFDGDGRSDLAVFRPSNGTWYQLRSLTGQAFVQQFGAAGDVPLAVDYDGDGIGDLTVFRPSDGSWHFWTSASSSYIAFPFGASGDVPVPADYDGDGKTDAAVFRATSDPAQPDFYILLTGSGAFQGYSWGIPGDIPLFGDYDGDGKADVSIFRPTESTWFLLRSTAGFTSVSFGNSGDRPVASAVR